MNQLLIYKGRTVALDHRQRKPRVWNFINWTGKDLLPPLSSH